MFNTTEDEGAIAQQSTQPIPEIPKDSTEQPPNETKPRKKPSAPKRSSLEKAIDISLTLCEKIQVDQEPTQQELTTKQIMALLEKEKTKHEELYLLFKIYDKLTQARESNENSLKNDIDYYKNDLLEIQSFLQKKRKPKLDSIELLKNESLQEGAGCVPVPIENDQALQAVPSCENGTMDIDGIPKDKLPEEAMKEKKKPKAKRQKKIKEIKPLSPCKSISSIEDINCPQNNSSPNEKAGGGSAEKKTDKGDKAEKDKQCSEKKKQVDKSNRSIMNFFQPKIKDTPQKMKDVINSNDPLISGNGLDENNNQFPLIYNNNIITYDIETLPKTITPPVQSYYAIKGEEITKETLGSYFNELKGFFNNKRQMSLAGRAKRFTGGRLKIIHIHDSFTPNKKFPEKPSSKINPKNPLIKDDYLIDYDKDSEEEFMEENAEDIQSNDNSSEDNEESEDQDNPNEQWIVPDGHLSEGEISEKEALEDRLLFEKSKPKMGSIMDILEIRKTFNKPIIISFNQKTLDHNHKRLCEKLSMKIFKFDSVNLNNNLNCPSDDFNTNDLGTFPLKIEERKTKYNGVNNTIKSHLMDITYQIHGSFETKEQLIIQLNESFKDISKKGLNNFFKEKCIKLKHNINGKKYWIVKHEILNEINMTQADITKLLENHLNDFNEKEKVRLEEKEINRQKNQIEQAQALANTNQGDVDMVIANENNEGNPNQTVIPNANASIITGGISTIEGMPNSNAIGGVFNVNDEKIKKPQSVKKRKPREKKSDDQKITQSPIVKDNKKINDIFNFTQSAS